MGQQKSDLVKLQLQFTNLNEWLVWIQSLVVYYSLQPL